MQQKHLARVRRAKKTRAHIQKLNISRLSVHRTPRHIYAQVLTAVDQRVAAAASTLEQEVRGVGVDKANKIEAAKKVGKLLAERAKQSGILKVAFDRSGFAYHGRVKALAEGAREAGLLF